MRRRMQRRRGNASRGVLALQERIGTEGHCKSTHAQLPGTDVGITSEFVTAKESLPCSNNTEVGFSSTSDPKPLASNGVSARIESLMQARSDYASPVEFEIDASKAHWSEMDVSTSDEEKERLKTWERLRSKWGDFFHEQGDELVVGEKIAEGGQAEIFNAERIWPDGSKQQCVLKVFKEGYLLEDLEKQWPLGMLQNRTGASYYTGNFRHIYGARLVMNGRFAFQMAKYWGDLRKLIDFRMQRNNNEFPPFTNSEVEDIVVRIAHRMWYLHDDGIIHRDLKAANVLIWTHDYDPFDPVKGCILCNVADFESSVGVLGTGYWRAPEILSAVQDRAVKPALFTEKSDVYSFAMTVYEVLSGCIPFEGHGRDFYKNVIEGQRPRLPDHVDPLLKALLARCWHVDPFGRPSFKEIRECLKMICPSRFESLEDDCTDVMISYKGLCDLC